MTAVIARFALILALLVLPHRCLADEPTKSSGTGEPTPSKRPTATPSAAATPNGATPSAATPSAATRATAADSQEYLLRYKFSGGETLRWKVVHEAYTDTKIKGNTQKSESHSESTKSWKVTEVHDDGNITFVHAVESMNLWQQVGDRPTIRYNSATDEQAPAEYEMAAKTVGVPLSTVTMTPDGRVQEKLGKHEQFDLGLGEIVFPFPAAPVKVGASWHVPSELKVGDAMNRFKRIQVRLTYTLEDVVNGVATIGVKTTVLTPVNDPKIESQLVQKLVKGTIKFDIDSGRVRSRTINWNESVLGFNGADSNMRYEAQFSEELLPAEAETARKPE